MTPAPTLESLRRVEAMLVGAKEPSSKIDGAIYVAMAPDHCKYVNDSGFVWVMDQRFWKRSKEWCAAQGLPYGPAGLDAHHYTASIDAAKSWIPAGCGISMVDLEPGDGKPYASIYNKALGHIARGSAPTLPLAVSLAIVRAHIALSTTATMKEQKS